MPLSADLAPAILLIDDDEQIREPISYILEQEGYVVHQAGHGAEGLAVLESGERPSLVLLDLMMPVMNGWEFMEHLRARNELSNIPVIIISAAPDPAWQLAPVLRKPFTADTLLATVGQTLGRPMRRRDPDPALDPSTSCLATCGSVLGRHRRRFATGRTRWTGLWNRRYMRRRWASKRPLH